MDTTSVGVVKPERAPRAFPRVIAAIFMVISALALVICVGTVVGSWAVRGAAAQSIETLAASVDQRLTQAQADLDSLGQSVAEISGAVGAANDQVKAVGGRVDQAGTALAAVEDLINTKLGATLDSIAAKAERLRDVVASIESALATLSQIPIIGQLGGGYLDQADSVLGGVQDTVQQVTDLRQTVSASSGLSGQPLVAALDKMSGSLSRIQGSLTIVGTRVTAAKQGLAAMQSRLPAWEAGLTSAITYAIVVVTVMMLGLAIALGGVFVNSLSFFLGRDVLARWRHG